MSVIHCCSGRFLLEQFCQWLSFGKRFRQNRWYIAYNVSFGKSIVYLYAIFTILMINGPYQCTQYIHSRSVSATAIIFLIGLNTIFYLNDFCCQWCDV